MALNVGELYATVELKDKNFSSQLAKAEKDLTSLKRSLSEVEKSTIEADVKGADQIDKAAKSADQLGKNAKAAGDATSKVQINKQVATEADRAKRSTEGLSDAAGKAARESEKIKFPKQYPEDAEKAKKAVTGLGDGIAGAAAKFTKFTAATAGAAAVGAIGGSLAKGFQRLDSIDQATAKLEALGNSGNAVESIMDNALASVKGTSYGLGEAATTAASMVAADIKPGQELEGVLGTVADTAAIAGASMDEMGLIFGSVAARGKLQGDDLMQLLSRGVPVLQILGEELGKTSAEISDMVSKGEIDFQTFADAMEGYVGGGAKRMGDTFSGALKNLGAAFGRMGAEVLEGPMSQAPDVIAKITDQVDGMGAVVGPIAQEWTGKLAPAVGNFATSIIPTATAAIGVFSDGLNMSLPVLQALAKAITSLPTPVLAAGLLTLTARHKGWTDSLQTGVRGLAAWGRTANQANGSIGRMRTAFHSASAPLMVLASNTRAGAQDLTGLSRNAALAKGSMQQFGGVVSGVASGAMSGLRTGASSLMGLFGGPWGLAIMGATTALGWLVGKHMEAKQAEQEHEAAQRNLRASLDETTGAITEQTNELQRKTAEENGWLDTARQIGLAQSDVVAAMNGNADAMQRVDLATRNATVAAIEASPRWEKVRDVYAEGGITAEVLADALNGSAEAQKKLNDYMGYDDVTSWKAEVEDATEKTRALRDGVNGAADEMKKLQDSEFAAKMNEQAGIIDRTRQAFNELGDSIVSVPDDKSIVVDSMAPEVREQFRELGAEVEAGADGQVRVTFPEGMNIMAMLDEIGAKAKAGADGRVDLSDNTPEVKQRLIDLGMASEVDGKLMMNDNLAEVFNKQRELQSIAEIDGEFHVNDNIGEVKAYLSELGQDIYNIPPGEVRILDDTPEVRRKLADLGIETATLPSGHVAITDTTPENMARLHGVGLTTQSLPPGHVGITDTSDTNIRRLNDLGVKTTTLPNGKVVISENAQSVANRIKSILSPEKINTVSSHTVNIVRRIRDVFSRGDADGGVYNGAQVRQFADGGTTSDNSAVRAVNRAMTGNYTEPAHQAHIASPGTYRVFAESETGGEAYIPLGQNKRDRSERILNRVAGMFGYNLVDNQGQAVAFADGAVVPGAGVIQKLKYMDGTPYIFGGWSKAGVDCSGAVSLAINTAMGRNEWEERTATASQGPWLERRNFQRGKGQSGDIRVAYYNGGPGGGHTAMQLDNGVFIESGGNTGGGFTIGRTAGPLAGRGFTNWYYMPGAAPLKPGEGLEYFDELGGAPGAQKSYGATVSPDYDDDDTMSKRQRELNGGKGTLLRDGSVLELVAAVYSKQTGHPMDDDIVSWGQAIGLYSELAEKETKGGKKQSEKLSESVADKTKALEKAKNDLVTAEEDLRIKKLKRDETNAKENVTESQKASADLSVRKAEEKVKETKEKIAQLEREIKEQEEELAKMQGDTLVPVGGLEKVSGTSGNKYADAIIQEGRRRGITDRGIKIALATALVESNMKMYANPADPASMQMPHDAVGYDHDSVGLFQQRNNGAWGTTADRMDPAKSAGMFYEQLVKADYNTGDPGAHAQRVQRSAFPDRYGQKMTAAQKYLDDYNATSRGVTVRPMADGGILGNARQASINEGSAVLWAEAGPEAYIPLSPDKKARSIEIWKETGKRLGIDVMSMFNMVGSALPGLVKGELDFNTGGSTSLSALGLNMEAAEYRMRQHGRDAGVQAQHAVGAVFNGPVQINDPKKYLQGQLDTAGRQLGNAMRSVMLK